MNELSNLSNSSDMSEHFTLLNTIINRGYRSLIICDKMYKIIAKEKTVCIAINSNVNCWADTIEAHKVNIFIALGKIFDKNSRAFSLQELLTWLGNNKQELTPNRVMSRKNLPEELAKEYKKDIHKFISSDFSKLQAKLNKLQGIYHNDIAPWRDKIFAHIDIKINGALRKIDINLLSVLFSGAMGIYQDAYNAFYNGAQFSLNDIIWIDNKYDDGHPIQVQTYRVLHKLI